MIFTGFFCFVCNQDPIILKIRWLFKIVSKGSEKILWYSSKRGLGQGAETWLLVVRYTLLGKLLPIKITLEGL